ncbi:MAG: nuclear transport factor 2 family protein [Brumimicrobium sp.]|nr:nuclear transport factor 2 family protein [Brumimicrobium sp.]
MNLEGQTMFTSKVSQIQPKQRLIPFCLFIYIIAFGFSALAQQVPDTTFRYEIKQSAYPASAGPLILIDEAHNNLHTRNGGFSAFSMLLEQDGYRTEGINKPVHDKSVLEDCEVFVIANALHKSNVGNWTLPTPSAFTKMEIKEISAWVKQGGNLLLIADHMPYSGAANDLANEFGFTFLNGFAMTGEKFWPPSIFSIENGGLITSSITEGNKEYEEIESLTTFTGSAFQTPDDATPIIQFSKEHISLQPDTAWCFHENTPIKKLDGYYQGAVYNFGKGRIAVFGEAAMFTAQKANGTKAGFNSPYAPNNAQFILNLIHWLDEVKEYSGPLNQSTEADTDSNAIIKENREMENAFHANDFKKVASFYSDDAVMVGNRHQVEGRTAIDNYWLGLKDRGISWKLENVHLEVHDNVAIQRGISRMAFIHDGSEHLSEVRFTLVWKKIEGNWKIVVDHYSLL